MKSLEVLLSHHFGLDGMPKEDEKVPNVRVGRRKQTVNLMFPPWQVSFG